MPWNCHQQKVEEIMVYPWKILFRFNWEFPFQVQQLIPKVGNWQIPWDPGNGSHLAGEAKLVDPTKLGWELHPEAPIKHEAGEQHFLEKRSFRFLRISSLGLSFLGLSFLEFHPFQELFPGISLIFTAHFMSWEQRVMDGCYGHCNCKLQPLAGWNS